MLAFFVNFFTFDVPFFFNTGSMGHVDIAVTRVDAFARRIARRRRAHDMLLAETDEDGALLSVNYISEQLSSVVEVSTLRSFALASSDTALECAEFL